MPNPNNLKTGTNLQSKPKNQRPKVHCPSCASSVWLPASLCPHCQTDLRTGMRPPPTGLPAHLSKLVMALAIVVTLAGAYFFLEYFKGRANSEDTTTINQHIDEFIEEWTTVKKD